MAEITLSSAFHFFYAEMECSNCYVGVSSSSGGSSSINSGSSSSSINNNTNESTSNSDATTLQECSEHLLSLNNIPSPPIFTILSLDTKVDSLNFRPGVRYLFTHCSETDTENVSEQYLYVTDVHLHSFKIKSMSVCGKIESNYSSQSASFVDLPFFNQYPRQTFLSRVVAKKCAVCSLWSAQYAVYGDRLADRSPMHYCQ